jgi:hypothetical protein
MGCNKLEDSCRTKEDRESREEKEQGTWRGDDREGIGRIGRGE